MGPARAYADTVRRLSGETVPMSVPSDRKSFLDRSLLNKLFTRSAA